VVSRQYRYMGTLDLICELPRLGTTLIDVKTSKGVYPETALQLAAYGLAETMFSADYVDAATEEPLPIIDSYAVLWLTPDSWELIPFRITDREFRVFLYLLETARWLWTRAGDNKHQPTDPVVGEALARPRPQEKTGG